MNESTPTSPALPDPAGSICPESGTEYVDAFTAEQMRAYAAAQASAFADAQMVIEELRRERSDLALLIGRLIRRMRAARAGEGMAAADDVIEQFAIGYLQRKGLVSPLRGEETTVSTARVADIEQDFGATDG